MLMAGVTKHATTMSDGRELIYYDDADSALPAERAADLRELDPRPATAALRQDPFAPATPANPSEVPSNYDVAVFENRRGIRFGRARPLGSSP